MISLIAHTSLKQFDNSNCQFKPLNANSHTITTATFYLKITPLHRQYFVNIRTPDAHTTRKKRMFSFSISQYNISKNNFINYIWCIYVYTYYSFLLFNGCFLLFVDQFCHRMNKIRKSAKKNNHRPIIDF